MVKCLRENCDQRARYGSTEFKMKRYCFKHKFPDHIDIVHTCKVRKCLNPACYGPKRDTRRRCDEHRFPTDHKFAEVIKPDKDVLTLYRDFIHAVC